MTPTAAHVQDRSPEQAAHAVAVAALLNCHIRETGAWSFTRDRATLPLHGGGRLEVAVRHRTPTDRCAFAGPPVHVDDTAGTTEPGLDALARLLLGHVAAHDPRGTGRHDVLLSRIHDSARQIAGQLEARADDLDALYDGRPLAFIDGEQGLLLGHPLHPTAKSREELATPQDRARFSPELRGRFPLRWLAVDAAHVEHGSAEREDAPTLAARILRTDPDADVAAIDRRLRELGGDRVLVPAHPWELDHLLGTEPRVQALVASGALVDLGAHGAPVTPTSSLRTVYREDLGWQLKFSLHVRVTNSMRVTLHKELRRAVEAAHLATTVVGSATRRAAPQLAIVHDPAYLAVTDADGVIDGLSVLLRSNALAGERPICLASLCEPHPLRDGPSRLGAIVTRLADATGVTPRQAAHRWFEGYCEVVVSSLVRLFLDVGLCFEPHQQNTLLTLDGHGLPERLLIRDSQGYFHREAAHADLVEIVPGLGEATESIFPEALADERLVYYPFLNAAVGVIDQLGLDGVADERELLGVLRDRLERERQIGGRYPHTLLDRLLDDERWPCKGNLRTRLHDLDELVGDIATQSVYDTIPNPLRAATP